MKSGRMVVLLVALAIMLSSIAAPAIPLVATQAKIKVTKIPVPLPPPSPSPIVGTGTRTLPVITITGPTVTVPKPSITLIPIPTITITIPLPTVTIKPIIVPTPPSKPVKKYTIIVKVDPPLSGQVKPLGVGRHSVAAGTKIALKAVPNAGYDFDHWTIDGYREVFGPVLRLRVNANHEIVAHFREWRSETTELPSIPVSSSGRGSGKVAKGCSLPAGFPESVSFTGMYADLVYNEDLLADLDGGGNGTVVVGRLAMEPQPWYRIGVRMSGLTLQVGERRYHAELGVRDYGLIYLSCSGDRLTIRVAGLTRYGTRAALLWLLNNPGGVDGKALVVVEWTDMNSDGKVEIGEISPIITEP